MLARQSGMNKQLSSFIQSFVFAALFVIFVNPSINAGIQAGDDNDQSQQKTDSTQQKQASEDTSAEGGLPVGDEGIVSNGKTLFNNNCKQCHSVGEEDVIGPGLKGVTEKREIDWLKSWIKNSSKMVSDGDEIAVQVYEEYDEQQMPAFNFDDKQLTSILAYIKAKSTGKIGGEGGEDPSETPEGTTADSGDGVDTSTINLVLSIFLIILVVLLIVLVLIITILTRYLKDNTQLDDSEKYVVDQRIDFSAFFKSKAFKTIIVFIFIIVAGKYSLDGMVGIGVQQGYAPTQPVAFSHKLHAGKYEIDCEYCHTGVRKGKNANIPSANICMNCHNQVRQESPEIQKIYKAVKYDRPIEWVRVHNLPDFAYFNHSQHVKVGGVECQQCHGPIEKMEVVQQYSPLTMGWCINCHRKTEIKDKGKSNDYYNKLKAVHEGEKFTVEQIGGLECAKCHY